MPITLVNGPLNTENAYAWPIQRWTASAAGGTIQRENPGFAMVASFEKNRAEPELCCGSVMLLMVGLPESEVFVIGASDRIL
jgi:hypothetical protein